MRFIICVLVGVYYVFYSVCLSCVLVCVVTCSGVCFIMCSVCFIMCSVCFIMCYHMFWNVSVLSCIPNVILSCVLVCVLSRALVGGRFMMFSSICKVSGVRVLKINVAKINRQPRYWIFPPGVRIGFRPHQ